MEHQRTILHPEIVSRLLKNIMLLDLLKHSQLSDRHIQEHLMWSSDRIDWNVLLGEGYTVLMNIGCYCRLLKVKLVFGDGIEIFELLFMVMEDQ